VDHRRAGDLGRDRALTGCSMPRALRGVREHVAPDEVLAFGGAHLGEVDRRLLDDQRARSSSHPAARATRTTKVAKARRRDAMAVVMGS
jgi:hypothetical protein